ncbi:hypothetical protein Abac_059_012 [Acetobacter aceti NBRC 14818]|nr:hypothetical protein Abac_059_012 [Acetobacter aceti NBRC 14818]
MALIFLRSIAQSVEQGGYAMKESQTDLTLLVQARAAAIGLDLSDRCLPGVLTNTELLGQYADLLNRHVFSDECEPAFEYVP